jgi:hypothetical protein
MAKLFTLVNRTSKTLYGTWDGQHYDLAPGKHAFEEVMCRKFKDQNPIMGTEDPYNLQMQYLIGIEEDGDDCSPIEQSKAVTRQPLDKDQQIVPGKKGIWAEQRAPGLPLDPIFGANS